MKAKDSVEAFDSLRCLRFSCSSICERIVRRKSLSDVCCASSAPVRGEPSVKRDCRRGRVLGVMVAMEGVGEAIVFGIELLA